MIMEALLRVLLATNQASSSASAPFQGSFEGTNASASSPCALAFDAGQGYQRAMNEYNAATQTFAAAQQAQCLQQQLGSWMNAKVAEPVPEVKIPPAAAATSNTDYVQEPVDKRLKEQWQRDEKYVESYKAAQGDENEKDEKKDPPPKQDSAPKAKAMPIKMQRIGCVEVPAGTLELYARLLPCKTTAADDDDVIEVQPAGSKSVPPASKPAPPAGPPPFLKQINKPPPPVPVLGGADKKNLGFMI